MDNIIFNWSEAKNRFLKEHRNISFEEVVIAVQNGGLLEVIDNPSKNEHQSRQCMIVNINHYAFIVPFIMSEEEAFLTTIFPSRKFTKLFFK
jgi:uncharacterized DUF497 family protein